MGRVFDFVRIEGGKKGEGAVTSYNNSGKAEEGGQKKLFLFYLLS
jgi:hypothetical protein